jgi:hypothetical protein
VNVPDVPVTKEPPVQLGIVTSSSTSERIGVDNENPFPETFTIDPTGPWLGVTVIVGTVTVNVPVANRPPTSVAVTVVPEVPLGTSNVHAKDPVLPVVSEPDTKFVIDTPSNTRELNGVDTEKPVPETSTVAPTGPRPGAIVIASPVTLKVTPLVVVSVATSVPVTG